MERLTKIEKAFSKKESAHERAELASQIKKDRREKVRAKQEQEMKHEQVAALVSDVEGLRQKLEAHEKSNIFAKIKNSIAIKHIQTELNEKTGIRRSLEEELARPIEGAGDVDNARKRLDDFYVKERRKWAEAPYSKEEVKELFQEEHLAQLSLEEYAALLRRFPGEMVTHVTRQGVRDHVAMYEHTAGMGELHNGFKEMMRSGRLNSRLGAAMAEAQTAHDICEMLNGGKPVVTRMDILDKRTMEHTDPRALVARLKGYTETAKDFHDSTAIHMAMGKVLDQIYGGERGNEIFIAYPAAHIASQYNFLNIRGKGVVETEGDDRYNDLYVWADNEERGMDINAGMVFLPSGVQVDRVSGTQFELDEQGTPIERAFEEGEDSINVRAFKKSDQTIDAKEYWEAYFVEHPKERPSKIVYYDARMTPTEALWEWKEKNGIVDKGEAAALGFDENELHQFNRPGAEEAATHLQRVAVDALVKEYGLDTILWSYNPQVFAKPQEEWQNSIDDMYKVDGIGWK